MRPALAPLFAAVLLTGCLGQQDDPTLVHDLRVLGVQLEAPELMAPTCQLDPSTGAAALRIFSSEVRYTALLADPAGAGRAVHYELFGCASTTDRDCTTPDEKVGLAEGDVSADPAVGWTELTLRLRPALATLADKKTLLLQKVYDEDQYKGLGGLRMPLVLHLKAGDEEIWAQKLMVFNCAFFPESKQNVNPALPGVTLKGDPWNEGDLPQVTRADGPFKVAAMDFSALEEDYVVPAFDLSEVSLHESWRINWYATMGTFSPGATGGTDVGGEESKPFTEWKPSSKAGEQDVQFWMVVRDGRGGMSWLTRRLHYKP